MASNDNIKIFTAADIEKYHKGQLSAQERHRLEKAALDDPFLADALEGYAVAGSNSQADLADLRKRLGQRTGGAKVIALDNNKKERKAIPWLRIAVMLVILVGAGLLANQLLLKQKNNDEITAVVPKKEEIKATDSVTGAATVVNNAKLKDETVTLVTENSNRKGLIDKDSGSAIVTTKDISPNTTTAAEVKSSEIAAPLVVVPTDEETAKKLKQKQDENKKYDYDLAKGDGNKDKAIVKNVPAAKNMGAVKEQPVKRSMRQDNAAVLKENEGYTSRNENDTYNYAVKPNTFRGRVTDNANRGLPFANVTNLRDNIGTYTDANGNFVLTSPDTVLDVRVRSLAFEDNVAQLRNDAPANQVVMQDDRKNISEVIVNTKPNAQRRQQDKNENMKLEEPEPADGWENYDVYLVNNLNVPTEFTPKQDAKQSVEVSFEVDKNGEPVNIRVEKSLCKTCDKEAIRLVKEGPKWKRKAKKGRTTVTVTF